MIAAICASLHGQARKAGRRLIATSLLAAVLISGSGLAAGGAQAVTVPQARPAAGVASSVAPLQIKTGTLPSMKVGKKYSHRLAADGGRAPYVWHLSGGTLPEGISLSHQGTLSGKPSVPGNMAFGVEVTDSSRPTPTSVSVELTLDVLPTALRITTTGVPKGATGSLYSDQLDARGGIEPYSWKLWTGQLPPGISLGTSGELSGTPTNRGTYKFKVQLSDSASPPKTTVATYSLVVTTPRLAVGTKSLPSALVGSLYAVQLTARGGLPPLTWTVKSGLLPSGLSLSSSGVLSGTPSVAGTYRLRLKVADSSMDPVTESVTYKLTVNPVPLSISTASMAPATVGTPYTATLSATGGISPYYFSLAGGSPPDGLQISPAGAVSGTPTTPGTFHISIRVKDSSAQQLSTSRNFKFVVDPMPLVISTTGLPAASLNNPYAAALATSGGTAPYTWQLAGGHLPPGIVMTSAGYLSGITSLPGVYTFSVEVADSSPVKQTGTATMTLLAASSAANWSGYVQTGTYKEVTGTFVVPTVQTATAGNAVCSLASGTQCPSEVAQWVGLDGVTTTSLIQAGVIEVAGTPETMPTYQAFWEISPSAAIPISMTVNPGDQVTVTIFKTGEGLWAIALDDDTTGQLFRTEQPYTGPGSTADFIVEAPEVLSTTGNATLLPLASFSPATNFTNLQTVGGTSATAALVLVQAGVQVATPSLKSPTGFAVGYGSLAPDAPEGK